MVKRRSLGNASFLVTESTGSAVEAPCKKLDFHVPGEASAGGNFPMRDRWLLKW